MKRDTADEGDGAATANQRQAAGLTGGSEGDTMSLLRCAPVAALLIILYCLPAGADGGVFWIPGTDAGHSADQRAVLIQDAAAGTETILVSTKYEGPAADFAWLVPVPKLPTRDQVGTWPGGEYALEELDRMTAPTTMIATTGGVAGCGGCASGGSGASNTAAQGVEVVDRLSISGMDISLLTATQSADLASWLTDNGYRMPDAATPILDHYIAKQWGFVAVKLNQDRAGSVVSGYFPNEPLRITFATDRLVFPMRVSAISAGTQESNILLYTIAEHRMRGENVPTVQVTPPGGSFSSPAAFTAAYGQAFDAALNQQGRRALVVEYAGMTTGGGPAGLGGLLTAGHSYVLTRLRTRLRPEDMTDDFTFTANDSDEPLAIMASAGGGRRPVAGALLCLLLAVLTGVGRARRRGRQALTEALLVGLLLACVLAGA